MKKTIPFSKEIVFNTDIYEINSISLEHNLKINNNEINGDFILSGDYKESDSSLSNEPFIYNIPLNIDVDFKYDINNIKIDIEDFNYDICSKNKVKVDIVLSIDGIEEYDLEPDVDIYEVIEEDRKVEPVVVEEVEVKDKDKEEVTSIFNNFSDKDETYITYHVHIYREEDDIEKIIKTYNTTKEDLDLYNDLSNLVIGSKIIIPSYE